MAAILAVDIFKCIFLNENDRILIQISLKLVARISNDNKPALVQVMAWRWTGDKSLPVSMMIQSLMHICSTTFHHKCQNANVTKLTTSIICCYLKIKTDEHELCTIRWNNSRNISYQVITKIACEICHTHPFIYKPNKRLTYVIQRLFTTHTVLEFQYW